MIEIETLMLLEAIAAMQPSASTSWRARTACGNRKPHALLLPRNRGRKRGTNEYLRTVPSANDPWSDIRLFVWRHRWWLTRHRNHFHPSRHCRVRTNRVQSREFGGKSLGGGAAPPRTRHN